MIQSFDLTEIRLMEFFQVMQNVKTFLEKQDLADLGLVEAKKAFDQKLEAFDNTIKPLTKSLHTKELHALDDERDKHLVGLIAHCRAFVSFPEAEKAKAAELLLATIEKYGKNLQNKTFQEETAIIYSLLKDFEESALRQALVAIGAEKRVEEIAKANEKFAQTNTTRTEERGEIVIGATKQARKELNEAYKHIIKSINALSYINGTEKYQSLANALNEEIKRARAK